MSSEPQPSRRANIGWGLLLVALSLVVGALVHLQPQNLRVPAWVAYSSVAAFFFAGLLMLAAAARAFCTQGWLAVAVTLSILLPGLWVAFGTGDRQCAVMLPFLQLSSAVVCRAAFGIGSLMVAGILVLYVRHALNAHRRD